jgi:hypothetical protein
MLALRLAAFVAAMFVSFSLPAAEPAAPEPTAAGPTAAELVQQARKILEDGNKSREAALKANPLLWRAIEMDQRNGPALVLMAYVQETMGGQPQGAPHWYHKAKYAGGIDEPWLIPYHLWYAEKYDLEKVQYYRELFAKSGQGDPKAQFNAHHELMNAALMRRERETADAEYAELVRMQPDEAFIPGDYAQGVMLHFQDFDAGERYARKALAMRDYPHARGSLSLALYGKWAKAVREGRDPSEVRALLAAAKKNDPDARHVPTCALGWPPLKFVADALQGLYRRNYLDPTMKNC